MTQTHQAAPETHAEDPLREIVRRHKTGAHTGITADKATYYLVHLKPKADIETVRRRLVASLNDVEVLTSAEFSDRSRSFWLFGTGAGMALFASACLAYQGRLLQVLGTSAALLVNPMLPKERRRPVSPELFSSFRFGPAVLVAAGIVSLLHWGAAR